MMIMTVPQTTPVEMPSSMSGLYTELFWYLVLVISILALVCLLVWTARSSSARRTRRSARQPVSAASIPTPGVPPKRIQPSHPQECPNCHRRNPSSCQVCEDCGQFLAPA